MRLERAIGTTVVGKLAHGGYHRSGGVMSLESIAWSARPRARTRASVDAYS